MKTITGICHEGTITISVVMAALDPSGLMSANGEYVAEVFSRSETEARWAMAVSSAFENSSILRHDFEKNPGRTD